VLVIISLIFMQDTKNFDKEFGRKGEVQNLEELTNELMGQIKTNASLEKFVPKADVWELEAGYKVFVYLPGIDKDSVSLEVRDGFLIISGERNIIPELAIEKAKLLESSYGQFQRRIKLNQKVNLEAIIANFESGILNITIPKIQNEDIQRVIKVA
jgi:HSP20 family protein